MPHLTTNHGNIYSHCLLSHILYTTSLSSEKQEARLSLRYRALAANYTGG